MIGLMAKPMMIIENKGYDSITGDAIGHINIDEKGAGEFSFDAHFRLFGE
jgi:hypothetical protein